MVTIRDVAKHLGVSVSTVSRAINNHPDIREETKHKVLEAMRQLNYTPNSLARSLIQRKTYTIGLMIPDIADTFFSASAHGVEETMAQSGHQVIYGSTGRNPEKEKAFLINAVERRLDGIIITPDHVDEEFLKLLDRIDIPIVMLRRKTSDDSKMPFVDVDHYSGACVATEHLISLGHQEIGFIGLPTQIGEERFRGYADTLRQHNLTPYRKDIMTSGRTREEVEGGRTAMKHLHQENPQLTAVFAANDQLGIGVLEYLAINNISVPENIAVIGFDNIVFSDLHWIKLSTMEQPRKEMGIKAAQLLLQMILKKEERPRSVILKANLIQRRSTIGE